MTITYPKGTVLNAMVLSHEEHEIRAIAPGCDDVLTFTRTHGTWISDDLEPVTLQFEWQRREAAPVFREADYICSRALADHLIGKLRGPARPEPDEADKLYVFSPDGARVAIHRTDLLPM